MKLFLIGAAACAIAAAAQAGVPETNDGAVHVRSDMVSAVRYIRHRHHHRHVRTVTTTTTTTTRTTRHVHHHRSTSNATNTAGKGDGSSTHASSQATNGTSQ
jgi:hypothetical protein